MSVNKRTIGTSPQVVWEVTADSKSYERWVVGAKKVRKTEGNWPDPGARFHHSIGAGPLVLRDCTEVLDVTPTEHLRLRAGLRPVGAANVTFDLEASDEGTIVTMTEEPVRGWLARMSNQLLHLALRDQNAETLHRLDQEAHKVPSRDPSMHKEAPSG